MTNPDSPLPKDYINNFNLQFEEIKGWPNIVNDAKAQLAILAEKHNDPSYTKLAAVIDAVGIKNGPFAELGKDTTVTRMDIFGQLESMRRSEVCGLEWTLKGKNPGDVKPAVLEALVRSSVVDLEGKLISLAVPYGQADSIDATSLLNVLHPMLAPKIEAAVKEQ
jgi:hypothetical protein